MSMLFTIFIMWVLYENSLCSHKLALLYTIIGCVCILLTSAGKTIKDYQAKKEKERKEFAERMAQYKFEKN